VTWLRRLVADISPRKTRFIPKSVHVRFAVNKETMGQFCLRVYRFSPLVIPLPFTHHFYLHFICTRSTNERSLETFQKVTPFPKSGKGVVVGIEVKSTFTLFSLQRLICVSPSVGWNTTWEQSCKFFKFISWFNP